MERAKIVEVRPTEELTAADRESIIDVCIAAHDNEAFRDLFTFIKGAGRHVLSYVATDLVAHAVVTTRWLQPEGLPILKTAFVDAVSTHPAHQGHGHATAVMLRLAESIDDYEIGCLQTDIPGFYVRVGWELWRGPLAGRGEDGLIPTPGQLGVMVRRLPRTPPLDLDAGLSIEIQPSRIWE